jgi:hypothetical protein
MAGGVPAISMAFPLRVPSTEVCRKTQAGRLQAGQVAQGPKVVRAYVETDSAKARTSIADKGNTGQCLGSLGATDHAHARVPVLPPPKCRRAAPGLVCEQARESVPLKNWPLKIQLEPSNAPHLLGARLVIAADRSPFAYPDFHRRFLPGRVLLVACSKFGDAWFHRAKLAQIVSPNRIKEVHVVHVDVPCCGSRTNRARGTEGCWAPCSAEAEEDWD